MERKIAINGFGRIGRIFLRTALVDPELSVVAVNDLGDLENLAYLFKYDTVYGRFPGDVKTDQGNHTLVVNGRSIKVLQEKDPTKLPWKELAIDVVVESTGAFDSFEKAKVHVETAGARHAVITAPAKDDDGVFGKTILMGVNEHELGSVPVTSNASCTTNACASVIWVLTQSLGMEAALLNTTHAYTATQSLVDSPVKGSDFRRGRAGAQNMGPSSTGAAMAVGRVIPEAKGNFDGIAIRVPVACGSLADITFISKRQTSVEEVNEILRAAQGEERWRGILKVSDEQLVSSDVIGEPYAAIVDAKMTRVVGGKLVKVLSWYDNEFGYVSTLVKHVKKIPL